MGTNRKQQIESAFREAIQRVCNIFDVSIYQMSLQVHFISKDKIKLVLCRKDVPEKVLDLVALLNSKMIGLGLSREGIKKLLQCVHYAFMKENGFNEPERISLLLYESKAVGSACIGILIDDKPFKALKISEIFEAMCLGDEQFN